MSVIFEFDKWIKIQNSAALSDQLKSIWEQRTLQNNDDFQVNKEADFQPFLKFEIDKIRAKNFVGFIQNDDTVIEIYPKVFKTHEHSAKNKILFLKHIFYWLNYCKRWKFPFSKVSVDSIDSSSLPELIIRLIGSQFLEVITTNPLSLYQETEEVLQMPRGRINFNRYINNSMSFGNFQNIDCDHSPLVFDNIINRAIKYCSRLLLTQTKLAENQRILQEIILLLDEVTDARCSSAEIQKVIFNRFQDDYINVAESCKLILDQQIYSNEHYTIPKWSLLMPMEYIFEDFIASFIEENFSHLWKVEYQKSDLYLASNPEQNPTFNLKHDILITNKLNPKIKIIIDTKYKLRDQDFKNDPKRGIDQNDIYQVLSYAHRRGCSNVIIFYPNISENVNPSDQFQIQNGFSSDFSVTLNAIELPFWSIDNFSGLESNLKEKLSCVLEAYLKK